MRNSKQSNILALLPMPSCLKQTESSSNDISIQTDNNTEPSVYERLFTAMNQPVIVIDLNSYDEKNEPFMMNPAATILIESSKTDFFLDSHLDKANASLGNFIQSVKSKVAQEVFYSDIFRTSINDKEKTCEIVFAFTGTTFTIDKNRRILGILLMETSRTVEEELSTVESFKASLISALSHELNNPVNSLIPLIKMLPNCFAEDTGEDIKAMALSSAFILKNKINDLIDYASLETKNMKLNLTEFFVENLFDDLNKIFKLEAERNSNLLEFKIKAFSNRKLKILADRNRLEQILIKLITNANKYTNKGSILVQSEENKSNFNILFTVSDTGSGISKERLEVIFAPLQFKNRNKNEHARLPGLGLDIAKGICECMESKLNVISEVNKGTTFSFDIPTCRLTTFDDMNSEDEASISMDEKEQCLKREGIINCYIDSNYESCLKPRNSGQSRELLQGLGILKKEFINGSNSKSINPYNDSCNPPDEFDCTSGKMIIYNAYIKKVQSEVFFKGGIKSLKKSKNKVVLITDDLYTNRMVIREMLKKNSIKTIEANNGKEAASKVETSFDKNSDVEIELILMDLHMPVMNGVESTIEIRKLEKAYERNKVIPIVAVTAHDGDSDKNESLKAGMQDFVKKPATKENIDEIVNKYAPNLLIAH